ncbi:MAG: 5-formyltetrahydrofolate cyclo-ligase [archaeon GW2011_AR3]|nr:MAG: 5-formyltetrahydrofolate cyclo-ligase [archaeon GW2011_AR3]MBS3109935.1 5-formyltetrahydrofolate cyclo-ligase [Candidatus Woesearchaeota archaeon]
MKENLRKHFLEKRNALQEKQIQDWSRIIRANLESLPEFQRARSCMVFVSKGSEVFTHDLIQENLTRKRISVPATTKAHIIPAVINYFDELKEGMFGILEPRKIVEMDKEDIDLVIVPGIAFDETGNRLGYGKGYYDKFLKLVGCPKIALSFEMQIAEEVPRHSNDVKMDIIVTEQRVIKPGR